MSDESHSWQNAVSVDYRKINPRCARCGEDVTVIRVVRVIDGETGVSTLCDRCAEGEMKHIVEEEGFTKVPKRSSFLNSKIVDGISNEQAKVLAEIFGLDLFIAEEEEDEQTSPPNP